MSSRTSRISEPASKRCPWQRLPRGHWQDARQIDFSRGPPRGWNPGAQTTRCSSTSGPIALWSRCASGWFSLRGGRGPAGIGRRWLADHHGLLDVGEPFGTDDAVGRLQLERVLVDRLDDLSRRGRETVARDPARLDDPGVARAGPSSFAEVPVGVEDPRPNLLRLRIPADPLRPAPVGFAGDLNRVLANQEL